jgi:sugar O-acyltransferase (sialic acid O-acetyltransferase NeuD family)
MKTILFGAGPFASLAWYCLTHDSSDHVVAFTVDAAHRQTEEAHGLPVAPFEALDRDFSPASHAILFPLGAHDMNRMKQARFQLAKGRGYRIATYVSSRAIVWPDLQLGEGCIVFEGAVVQPFAKIGINTIVRSSVHISHHVVVGDHCFISAGACFGGGASVGDRCFVGLNATVRDGVTIAEGCFIAAGAVVVADTEPDGLYIGVPARRSKTPASQVKL